MKEILFTGTTMRELVSRISSSAIEEYYTFSLRQMTDVLEKQTSITLREMEAVKSTNTFKVKLAMESVKKLSQYFNGKIDLPEANFSSQNGIVLKKDPDIKPIKTSNRNLVYSLITNISDILSK